MSASTPSGSPIYDLLPKDISGFNELMELALDMRWSWNRVAEISIS
ncbi:MAG: hypothetical protein ABUL58_06055 [Steroidobacter sp.]